MTRIVFATLLLAGCYGGNALPDAGSPTPGIPCAVGVDDVRYDDAGVWGFADLHAHPAVHLGFNGNEAGAEGWLWGAPGVRVTTPGVVPVERTRACDGEAHSVNSSDQVTRATRNLISSLLGDLAHYPHGPGGEFVAGSGRAPYPTWPNARDLFHQQMHIESIHRAWQGGLRLLLASVTDNEVITAAFRSPAFPGDVVLDREDELVMAERQLAHIEDVARQNADWMEIVTSPSQAREAIRAGRLAVILGVELDALTEADVDYLYEAHGVRSVVPIHVVDNDVGGTAAYGDFFNSASGLMARHFGSEERRYIRVAADPEVSFRYGWLMSINLGIANYEPTAMGYSEYAALRYSPLPFCEGAPDGVPLAQGMINALGLIDARRIDHFMELGMLVDVAHMSTRSIEDALIAAEVFLDPARPDYRPYPLIDTHTGVFHEGAIRGEERDITHEHAARIIRNGGVIGIGTGGIPAETAVRASGDQHPYITAPILRGRWVGQPLLELHGVSPTGEVESLPPQVPPRLTSDAHAQITATGTVPVGGLVPFARVHYCPREGQPTTRDAVEVRFVCDAGARRCVADAALPFAADDAREIASIEIGLLDPRGDPTSSATCRTARDGSWTIESILAGDQSLDVRSIRLEKDRNARVVYAQHCERDTAPALSAARLYRVSIVSGGVSENVVRGATPLYEGNDVSVRLTSGGEHTAWASMNHQASWGQGVRLDQYIVSMPPGGTDPGIGIEVRFTTHDARRANPWTIDEIVLEELYDPIDGWVENYAALRDTLEARCRALCMAEPYPGCDLSCDDVRFPLGTDLDGFVPQFASTVHDVEAASGSGYAAYSPGGDGGPQYCFQAPLVFGTMPLRIDTQPTRFGASDDDRVDGIARGMANYGLFPELAVLIERRARDAASARGEVSEVPEALFRSAEETIEVWERAVATAAARR